MAVLDMYNVQGSDRAYFLGPCSKYTYRNNTGLHIACCLVEGKISYIPTIPVATITTVADILSLRDCVNFPPGP